MSIKTYFIRLYWQDFAGQDLSKLIRDKGLTILDCEVIGMADCNIYEVDKLPDPLPEKWAVVYGQIKSVGKFHN